MNETKRLVIDNAIAVLNLATLAPSVAYTVVGRPIYFVNMPDVRPMLPDRRHALPRWEISEEGRVIGWILETRIGKSSTTFYARHAVHPSGKVVNLENSTDFAQSVQAIAEFHRDPLSQSQHLPWALRPR